MTSPLRRGLTLIETLFTVVILGLVAGALLTSISGTTRSTQLRSATAQWLDLDRRARLLAPREGPLVLEVDAGQRTLRVRPLTDGAPVLLEATLPEFARGALEVDGGGAVVIDRRGRSVDYRIVLRGDAPLRERAWRVAGAIGAMREERTP